MRSGAMFARAVYRAAVRPAGPEPMMMTLRVSKLEMLLDDLLEVFLRRQAYDLIDDFSLLEQQDRWYASNLKLECGVRIVVHVQLANRQLAGVVGRQRLDRRRQPLARTAPFGPEIHEHRPARVQHRRLEITVCKGLHVVGSHSGLLLIPQRTLIL